MKRSIQKLVALLLALTVILPIGTMYVSAEESPAYTANENWEPNENGIYEISTPEDLIAFSAKSKELGYYSQKTVVLTNDIDLNPGWDASSGTKPTNEWTPLLWFYGTLDGQGYTISGLYHAGNNLSGFIYNGASTKINNLNVKNSYFEGKSYTGFVATVKGFTSFNNVYIDADFKSTLASAGGFAATYLGRAGTDESSSELTPAATFTNCVFEGNVTAKTYAGGILGSNNKIEYGPNVSGKGYGFGNFAASFVDCASYGSIVSTSGDKTAGIIGVSANLTNMTRCYGAASADTALLNAQKSDVEPVSKEDGAPLTAASVTLINCYYKDSTATAFTQTADAPTVTVKYNDNTNASEVRSASMDELLALSAFSTWGTNGLAAMPQIIIWQSSGQRYTANQDWAPSSEGVLEISTPEDLLAFSEMRGSELYGSYSGYTVLLTNDIDLNPGWDASSGTVPANVWKPLTWFFGTFDGQGYTISGLYCKDNNAAGFISNGAATKIKNLNVTNSYFDGKNYAGFVATIKGWTTFDNVSIDAIVRSEEGCAGGFAATYLGRAGTIETSSELTPAAKFTSCVFTGSVIAKTYAGGILGSNDKIAYGAEVDGKDYGYGNYAITLTDCANYGTVSTLSSDANNAAGLIGICANATTLTRCYDSKNKLFNARKSTIDPIAKPDATPLSEPIIAITDCYYSESAGEAFTYDSDAPNIVITYSDLEDEETVTELRSATVAQIVEASGFQKTDTTDGWKANESSTIALTEKLLCQLDGHTYKTERFESTCVAEGYTAHICVDCGFSYSFDKVAKLEHVESGEWIIDKEPTVLSFGGKHMDCTQCGQAIWMETIPKLIATVEPESTDTDSTDVAETAPETEAVDTTDVEENKVNIISIIVTVAIVIAAVAVIAVVVFVLLVVVKKKKRKN